MNIDGDSECDGPAAPSEAAGTFARDLFSLAMCGSVVKMGRSRDHEAVMRLAEDLDWGVVQQAELVVRVSMEPNMNGGWMKELHEDVLTILKQNSGNKHERLFENENSMVDFMCPFKVQGE